MATVTTFQEVVNNDNLPILTPYGIVKFAALGKYLIKMDAFGYKFTTVQINALKAFFENGEQNGWLKKLMYVLPFIGNSSNYAAAGVPLIDVFHGGDELLVAATNRTVPFGTQYSPYYSLDANNNIINSKPYRVDMALVSKLNPFDLFTKKEGFEYKGSGNFGFSWYGHSPGATSPRRIFQPRGYPVVNFAGFTAANDLHIAIFGREYIYKHMGDILTSGEGRFLNTNFRPGVDKGILEFSISDKNMTSIYTALSGERPLFNTLANPELAKRQYVGINAGWDNETLSVRILYPMELTTGFWLFMMALWVGGLKLLIKKA